MYRPLLITTLFTVFFGVSSGQQSPIQYSFRENDPSKKLNVYIANQGDKPLSNESIRFIVKLKNPSSQNPGNNLRVFSTVNIQDQHQQFRSDLNKITNSTNNARTANTASIHHEYTRAYNGFAMEGSSALKEAIAKLSYVAAVIEDKEVKAIDVVSNHQIKADRVWTDLGFTGKDISIGIIDTGIDYNHPDLGGGIGPSFKVKGGYDFVNSDNDPMDDNGHGTHVAGIAAANGATLKGVAPEADLYAFKVLNNYGSGIDSWILAAIERSLDPDQNPATDDKLDVVNMSLGRSIDPTEPISEAVNNAVQQGITYVVAAGNSYDYSTIGTPAIAKNAITVGATDQYDYTAYFSSKGPTENTYQIKPDVSAPGVDIYSSFPNNQYKSESGTSMATPHVTGAVALLLDKNPGWTPEIIKGALMGTAENPNHELIWHQGAGRINALKAIQSEFVMSPGSLSLGISDFTSSAWTTAKTVTIKNTSNSVKNFTITAEGENLDNGIHVNITPSTFSLTANSTREVEVSFVVNANTLPMKSFPQAYSGNILATSGATTVKSPFAFIHTRVSTVAFTGELPYAFFVIGTNGSNYYKVYTPGPSLSVILPSEPVDLIANYSDNYYVIKEGMTWLTSSVTFDKSQANNRIEFRSLDKDGQPLNIRYSSLGTALITGYRKNWMTMYFGPVNVFHVSDQTTYRFDMRLFDTQTSDPTLYYNISHSSGYGVYHDSTYANQPREFTKIIIENPSVSINATQDLTAFQRAGSLTTWNTYPIKIKNPLQILNTKTATDVGFSGIFFELGAAPIASSMAWETPIINTFANDSIAFSNFWFNPIASVTDQHEFHYKLGTTLPRPNARTNNLSNRVLLVDDPDHGIFRHYYGEHQRGNVTYELTQDGQLIQNGSLTNRLFGDGFGYNLDINIPENAYVLRLQYENHKVYNQSGTAETRLTFDTRQYDKNPPTIPYINLEVAGETSNVILGDQPAKIKFKVIDYCTYYIGLECNDQSSEVPFASLEIKRSQDQAWTTLPLSKNFNEYTADVPVVENGYYAIRLTARDYSNNSIQHEIKPAFLVDDYKEVQLIEPLNLSVNETLPVTFKWSDAAVGSYNLQVSTSESFQTLVYNGNVNGVATTLLLSPGKQYFWRVKPISDFSRWSAVYKFSTGTPLISLIQPTNNSSNVEIPTSFSWTALKGSLGYQLLLSSDPNFSLTAYTTTIVSNDVTVTGLSPNKTYYWKIGVKYLDGTTWSEPYQFTTRLQKVNLISPVNGASDQLLTTKFRWSDEKESNYLFHISSDPIFQTYVSYTVAEPSFPLDRLTPGMQYFWRVKPANNTSTWSEIYRFKTVTPIVSLREPLNNATNVAVSTELKWEQIDDVLNYTVYLAKDPGFTNAVKQQDINTNSILVEQLSSSSQYFWKVRANFNSALLWSPVFSFDTQFITDIEEPNFSSLSVFPNPALDEVNIEFYAPKPNKINLQITNSLGSIVFTEHFTVEQGNQTIQWDGRDNMDNVLPAGVYIANLNSATSSRAVKIVLKK